MIFSFPSTEEFDDWYMTSLRNICMRGINKYNTAVAWSFFNDALSMLFETAQ